MLTVQCKICGSSTKEVFSRSWTGHSTSFPYFQCENIKCNFLHTNYLDQLSSAEISAIYESNYWEGMGREGSGQIAVDKAILAQVLLPQANKVLDIGSGEGWGVQSLCQSGFDAYGYDIIAPKVCNDRITVGPRECVIGTYPIITAIEVLEHLLDPIEACRWISSLLPEGGIFAFSTYLYNPQKHDQNWWYLDHIGHVSLHSKDSLRLLAEKTGFRVVSDILATHVWVRGDKVPMGADFQVKAKHISRKIMAKNSYRHFLARFGK
jgi:hypothetical protein